MNLTLREIVASYLDEQNLGQAEYAKAYAIAIRGWRELNWDIVASKKQVIICLDCNHTAKLPEDFISETNVGIDNGNGGIASLTRDSNMLKPNAGGGRYEGMNNYRTRVHFSDINADFPTYTSYGIGSSVDIGHFSIDKASHTILVSPEMGYREIILEYLSYTNSNCEYEINELASEALLAYIRWRFSLTGTKNGLGLVSYNRQEYYNEKSKARLRIKKMTTADLNQASRESVKFAIRS